MAAGHPPAKIASLLREHIGLTPWQAQQVANYRADLESLQGQRMKDCGPIYRTLWRG
jgi:hypothetical protein